MPEQKKRGRPSKAKKEETVHGENVNMSSGEEQDQGVAKPSSPKKARGRPSSSPVKEVDEAKHSPSKEKGKLNGSPLKEMDEEKAMTSGSSNEEKEPKPAKKRGRPKSNKPKKETDQNAPIRGRGRPKGSVKKVRKGGPGRPKKVTQD